MAKAPTRCIIKHQMSSPPTTCQHCNVAIAPDQDAVHLAGRCGHSLHLVCYDKRRAVGVASGCCDGESTDLGDVLRARLYDPLAVPAGSGDARAATARERRTGFGGIVDAFKSLDALVDSKISQTAGTAVRAGLPVKALLDMGVDATAIVRDPGNPLIAPLLANYTTADLAGLGFTWGALLAVGLSARTWDRGRWSVARTASDLKITAEHLLQGLCAGQPSALPSLGLVPAEWQILCGEHERGAQFFRRVGVGADTFLELGYAPDAWRYQLGLETTPVEVFGLTAQQCWDWLDASGTDGATVAQQFKFLFGSDVPERPGYGGLGADGVRGGADGADDRGAPADQRGGRPHPAPAVARERRDAAAAAPARATQPRGPRAPVWSRVGRGRGFGARPRARAPERGAPLPQRARGPQEDGVTLEFAPGVLDV